MLTDNNEEGDAWIQDSYSNIYDSSGDDSYSDSHSGTLPGRKRRSARRPNSAARWTSVISIVLVVLGFASFMMALVFLAGPIMESLKSLGGGTLADDIALLPAETAGVVHIQIEEILKHQSEYVFLRNNPLTQLHSAAGDDAEFSKTVRSFTIAIPDASANSNGVIAGGRAASAVGAPFMVIRLNKAVSESELERQSGAKGESLEGKSVFRSRGSVLCQLDSRTLLTGNESDILNALKGIRNTGLESELKVPITSGQLCFVIRTNQFAKFAPPMPEPQPNTPDALRNLSGLLKSIVAIKLASGAISLDAEGMNIHLEMQLQSPEQALMLKDQMQLLLKDGLDGLPMGRGASAANSAISSLQKVIEPTQVTTNGSTVAVRTRLLKEQLNEFAGQIPF